MSAKDIRILDPKPMHQQHVSKVIGQKALEVAKKGTTITMNKAVTQQKIPAPQPAQPAGQPEAAKRPLTLQQQPRVLPVAPDPTPHPGETWTEKKSKDRYLVLEVTPQAVTCSPADLLDAGETAEVLAMKPSAFVIKFAPGS